MSSSIQIEMQVDHHTSGRFTLKERTLGTTMWTDVNETDLFGNMDTASFYRAVAKRMAQHSAGGIVVVEYVDTAT